MDVYSKVSQDKVNSYHLLIVRSADFGAQSGVQSAKLLLLYNKPGYSIIFLDQGFVQGTSTRAGNIAEHLRIPSITTSLCVSIPFILHQTSIHSPDKCFVFF